MDGNGKSEVEFGKTRFGSFLVAKNCSVLKKQEMFF